MPNAIMIDMKSGAKIQIKTLLAQRAVKLKDLAQLLTERTGKPYTPNGLTHKLSRGSITYNEVLQIADILGYKIRFEDIND